MINDSMLGTWLGQMTNVACARSGEDKLKGVLPDVVTRRAMEKPEWPARRKCGMRDRAPRARVPLSNLRSRMGDPYLTLRPHTSSISEET